MLAASPASPVISAAAISSSWAASPPSPSAGGGAVPAVTGRDRADRLAHLAHLLHQELKPLVLGNLPLGLLQLRPGLQVHVHRLAADAPGQVVLRTVPRWPGCAHWQFGLPHLRHTAFSAPRRKSPTWEISPNSSARRRSSHARSRPEKSATGTSAF